MRKIIQYELLIVILIILLPVRIFAAVGFISTVDIDGDGIGDVCDYMSYVPNPIPITGGRCLSEYEFSDYDCCFYNGVVCCSGSTSFMVGGDYLYYECDHTGSTYCLCWGDRTALIEFDISGLGGLSVRGQIEASLSLTVKNGNLYNFQCIALYNMGDAKEDGFIEGDEDTLEIIAEICEDLQPEDTITFDVTSAVEHDLFDSAQTGFSGFALIKTTCCNTIEFYDHTDPFYAPRLTISDGDGIPNEEDNCPYHSNPDQEDTYPPGGNGIGDAWECEGNFDCDDDCDGTDAATFKIDCGRSTFDNPCEVIDLCNGDFDCDQDCDGTDAALFKEDFGRSQFNNPCPACLAGEWCSYPLP